jgi:hypothetical protein
MLRLAPFLGAIALGALALVLVSCTAPPYSGYQAGVSPVTSRGSTLCAPSVSGGSSQPGLGTSEPAAPVPVRR